MQQPVQNLQLGGRDRLRIAAIAEALIPGGAGLPSAKEAEVEGPWIDRVLLARPDLLEAIRLAVASPDNPQAILDRLSSEDPDTLYRLQYAIAAAYLINPKVRAILGYPSSVPARQPAYPDESDAYLEDGILDAVIGRGPIFRSPPKTG